MVSSGLARPARATFVVLYVKQMPFKSLDIYYFLPIPLHVPHTISPPRPLPDRVTGLPLCENPRTSKPCVPVCPTSSRALTGFWTPDALMHREPGLPLREPSHRRPIDRRLPVSGLIGPRVCHGWPSFFGKEIVV